MAAQGIQRILVSLMETIVLVRIGSTDILLVHTDKTLDLSMITYGIRKDYSKLDVGVCGSTKYNILSIAWIDINDNGMVKFYNQNGDEAGCTLDNGFRVGSSCIASDLPSSTSSSTSSSASSSASTPYLKRKRARLNMHG